MKSTLRLCFAAALVGVLGLTAPASTARPLSITGRVTDASTGEPVEMAFVGIRAERTGTQTNENGEFRLSVTSAAQSFDLLLRHRCYHRVSVQIEVDPLVDARSIEVGMPYDNEKYPGVAPPLGGCPKR